MVQGDSDLTSAVTTLQTRIDATEEDLSKKHPYIKWKKIDNDIKLLSNRQTRLEGKLADIGYENTEKRIVANLSTTFFAKHQTTMVQAFDTTFDEHFKHRYKETDAKITELRKQVAEITQRQAISEPSKIRNRRRTPSLPALIVSDVD